jgi:hypothetical protein
MSTRHKSTKQDQKDNQQQQQKNQQQKTRQQGMMKPARNTGAAQNIMQDHEQEHPETRMTR